MSSHLRECCAHADPGVRHAQVLVAVEQGQVVPHARERPCACAHMSAPCARLYRGEQRRDNSFAGRSLASPMADMCCQDAPPSAWHSSSRNASDCGFQEGHTGFCNSQQESQGVKVCDAFEACKQGRNDSPGHNDDRQPYSRAQADQDHVAGHLQKSDSRVSKARTAAWRLDQMQSGKQGGEECTTKIAVLSQQCL